MTRKTSSRRRKATATASLELTWWDRLTDRQQHLLIAGFLIILSFAFFWPIHFGGRSLVATDIVQWRGMAEVMMQYRETTGEEPLWNPNAFGGMPGYLINYPHLVPQIDTLIGWLRKFIWPSSHFIVLLLGAYWLFFFLSRDKLASLLGACAYGLTTYIPVILVAGHNTKFIALAFAPYMVLAFAYTLRKPGLLASLLFAIAAAANIRAGHVQITYYVSFLIGIWWLVEGIWAIREKRLPTFLQATGWLVLGSVLALLMVAQPYLAIWEYKQFTIRGAAGETGGLDWSYAMQWSQGVSELITLLIAGAFGGGSQEAYWGPKPFTAGPHYIGGIVLALAIIAALRVRQRPATALTISAILMTLFALGSHAAWVNRFMFEHFPLFSSFRAPETWMVVVVFALAGLAAYGLWYLTSDEETEQARMERMQIALATFGGLAALVLLLFLFKGALFRFERPGEFQQVVQAVAQQSGVSPSDPRVYTAAERYLSNVRQERMELFNRDALRTLIFLLLGGGLFWLYLQQKVGRNLLHTALVLLVIIDLWGVDRRYLNEDVLQPERPIERTIPEYDFDRFIKQQIQQVGGPGHFRVLPLALNPMNNAQPVYHYEAVAGYHGAKLRVFQEFVNNVLFAQGMDRPDPKALDMLNVRYIIARDTLPGTQVVFQSQTGLLVLENPDYLPRAYLVGRYEVISHEDSILQRLKSPDFNPRTTVILIRKPDIEPVPLDGTSVAEVHIEKYTPREIRLRVRTDAPRLLVLSEVYYPAGWKAYVDGKEVPIYQANYLFRALPVPEGDHEVVLRFDPASHRIGYLISLISTLLVYGTVLGITGASFLKKRRTSQ